MFAEVFKYSVGFVEVFEYDMFLKNSLKTIIEDKKRIYSIKSSPKPIPNTPTV